MLFKREMCPFSKVHPGVILANLPALHYGKAGAGIPIYVVNTRVDYPIKSGNDGLLTFGKLLFENLCHALFVIKL